METGTQASTWGHNEPALSWKEPVSILALSCVTPGKLLDLSGLLFHLESREAPGAVAEAAMSAPGLACPTGPQRPCDSLVAEWGQILGQLQPPLPARGGSWGGLGPRREQMEMGAIKGGLCLLYETSGDSSRAQKETPPF